MISLHLAVGVHTVCTPLDTSLEQPLKRQWMKPLLSRNTHTKQKYEPQFPLENYLYIRAKSSCRFVVPKPLPEVNLIFFIFLTQPKIASLRQKLSIFFILQQYSTILNQCVFLRKPVYSRLYNTRWQLWFVSQLQKSILGMEAYAKVKKFVVIAQNI